MVGTNSRGAALLAFFVCAFLSMLRSCSGHMIELEASSKECFFEDLNPGDQVRLRVVFMMGLLDGRD
jgi:hypothetical protein